MRRTVHRSFARVAIPITAWLTLWLPIKEKFKSRPATKMKKGRDAEHRGPQMLVAGAGFEPATFGL